MGRVKNHFHDEISASEYDDEDAAFMEGRRAALEGMDLPDGAYFAMAEEMGLDVFDED